MMIMLITRSSCQLKTQNTTHDETNDKEKLLVAIKMIDNTQLLSMMILT